MQGKWIAAIVSGAVLLLISAMFLWANNSAIGKEEGIYNDKSSLQVMAQRRFDVVTRLVDIVKAGSQYENTTQIGVTAKRMDAALNSGDVNTAQALLKGTFEAYPDLKANSNYAQLMTEVSTTENMIRQTRDTYNYDVQEYHKFVRRFPASALLSMMGYRVVDFQYLTFSDNNLPNQLFPTQP